MSWLDVKLGIRMLTRYPWLSAVSVIGMALAIAIGAAYFSIIGLALDSTLPVVDGDRIVTIQSRTVAGPSAGRMAGVSPADFVQWRTDLKSIAELGAFRDETRNLITADGRTDVVKVAAVTAGGFQLMRGTPLIGRPLLADDERPGAAPVLVIGYDAWRRHFDGDARAIGAPVHLDGRLHTVVGVMPEGFMFPIRHHYWVPLTLTSTRTPLDGDHLLVFGRLAGSVSLADARVELAAVGERMARAFPGSHAHVRPHAVPYTHTFTGVDGPRAQLLLRSFQLGAGVLLLVVAVNVAILVYARTATRTGEIVVRSALGATRGRVISQLFVEALVLTASAAALGLGIVAVLFRLVREWMKQAPHLDSLPYWFQPALSSWTVLYVVLLAVIAAVVIGAAPALKATGPAVHVRLQQFSGRGSGMQLGRIWTTLIVVQVAIAVAVLPGALHNTQTAFSLAMRAPAPEASEMLRGALVMSPQLSAEAVEPPSTDMTQLLQRLEADPEVTAVTFAQNFPGLEQYATIDAEGQGQLLARSTRVAPNLLDVFGVPILAGRGFVADDARPGANSVIVDQIFANALAPGTDVVGRRLRYLNRDRDGRVEFGPWLEIVGIVPAFAESFTAPPPFATPQPRFYHAALSDQAEVATIVVTVRNGDPRHFIPRLRATTASVDSALKLQELTSVVDAWDYELRASSIAATIILAVTGSVLLLSAAGMYAMMAFAVNSRRREIGIRAALGADARRVLASIFGRASAQLGLGAAVGLVIATSLESMSGGAMIGGQGHVLLPAVAGMMLTLGLLAALGPALRGLAVQPTEVLRGD